MVYVESDALIDIDISENNDTKELESNLSNPVENSTFTVVETGNQSDANPGDGICDHNAGIVGTQCTLRAAIDEANALAGADDIVFNIPGAGVHTIQTFSELPTINDTVNIDGRTQPGASCASSGDTSALHPQIEIDGEGSHILRFTSTNNEVRGLSLYDYGYGMYFESSSNNNIIQCNILGLRADGNTDIGGGTGLMLWGADFNTIGGGTAQTRNIISDNSTGIYAWTGATDNNIQGNFFGTDVTGVIKKGNNTSISVVSSNSIRNLIGGSNATPGGNCTGECNVISGGSFSGISTGGNTHQLTITGNYIGRDYNGNETLQNGLGVYGSMSESIIGKNNPSEMNYFYVDDTGINIYVTSGSSVYDNISIEGNYIKADDFGDPNSIYPGGYGLSIWVGAAGSPTATIVNWSFNNNEVLNFGRRAVYIGNNAFDGQIQGNTFFNNGNVYNEPALLILPDSVNIPIIENSISNSGDIAIDLSYNGPTANDLLDADTGGNNRQNYPDLTFFQSSVGSVNIYGNFNSLANTTFRLDFYKNTAIDDSGYGEAETHIGWAEVTTNGSGDFDFSTTPITFTPSSTVSVSDYISSTATLCTSPGNCDDIANLSDTSEVSRNANVLTVPVNSTGNSDDTVNGDGACDTGNLNADGDPECTLRAAIQEANALSGSDNITFDIPTLDSGYNGTYWQIQLPSTLPIITDTITIDASTQSGASCDPLIPKIEVSGPGSGDGFRVQGGNSVIRGLSITHFTDGIEINSDSDTIECNIIGLEPDGSTDNGNATFGIYVNGGTNRQIGGITADKKNVISGNGYGTRVIGYGVTFQGNYVGTDVSGTLDRGNDIHGLEPRASGDMDMLVGGTTNVTPGGACTGACNILSGNNAHGIAYLAGAGDGLTIQGNHIGTDVTGNVKIINNESGIYLNGPEGTIIGGDTPEERNVINGGNSFAGILIYTTISARNTDSTIIKGNYIGTNSAGTSALGNPRGIYIYSTSGAITENTVIENNVISGNSYGINIVGYNINNTLINNNFIGTNASSTNAIGNTHGIYMQGYIGDMDNTQISNNVISGNNDQGIYISGNTIEDTLITNNHIGTDTSNTLDLGNQNNGILIYNSSNNIIGGPTASDGNYILYNDEYGISLITVDNNTIQNNIISDNTLDGIRLGGSSNNIIKNIINSNGRNGVNIYPGTSNLISQNSIYDNNDLGINLGLEGVTLNDEGDIDTGANNQQNFPVINKVTKGSTIIEGNLNSTPNTTFNIEFFYNDIADASNFGEGKNYLGSRVITTNASGNKSFKATFSQTLPDSTVISATATDPTNNTSEFSEVSLVLSAPIAVDDSFSIDANSEAVINVLSNDSDLDGTLDKPSLTIITLPQYGTVTIETDYSIKYNPDYNYTGADTLIYRICDNDGLCDTAQVQINITNIGIITATQVPNPIITGTPLPTSAIVTPDTTKVVDDSNQTPNPTIANDENEYIIFSLKSLIVTGISIFPAFTTGILSAILYPRFIIYAIPWLKRKKKIEPWGIVFDSIKRKPIPFVSVKLYYRADFIQESITGLDGRYNFTIETGDYTIRADHPDYEKYEKRIKFSKENPLSLDIELHELSKKVKPNFIGKINITSIKEYIKSNLSKLNTLIFINGFLYSLYVTITYYHWINLIILISYFVILFFTIKNSRSSWGYTYSSQFKENRLPGVFVRVFSKEENRQIDVKMSDNSGNYHFFLEPGKYMLRSDGAGYISSKDLNIEISDNKKQPKKLNINLIRDRSYKEGSNESFVSPFKQR